MTVLFDNLREVMCDLWTRADLRSRESAVAYYRFIAEVVSDPFPAHLGLDDEPSVTFYHPEDERAIAEWLDVSWRNSLLAARCNDDRASFTISFFRGGAVDLIPVMYGAARFGSDESDQLGSRFLQAMQHVQMAMPLDFARICTCDEWIEKNVVRNYPEPDGYLNPWKVFGQDLNTMFPGVYWANYFGKDLAEWAGCSKWKLKRWHKFQPLAGGYLLVRSPTISTWKDESEADRELIEAIGPDRVFSKANLPRLPKSPGLSVPELET